MDRIIKRPGLFLFLLFGLCLYLFFFQLGGMALTDPDETFYAQTAKEMFARHEWVTPYLYGAPQFEKPILIYWLINISYRIFGVNEFAARFPSAVFALLGVFGLYHMGSLFYNKRVGLFSAAILATCVEYIILSRACVTDMALFTTMLFGAFFFFYAHMKDKPIFYIFSSVSFALAVLAKGPIAIILAGLAIIIYIFAAKRFDIPKKIPYLWCALALILVAAPWYMAIYHIHGKAFVDAFFGFHNVTRFLESEHEIGSQFYYNIPIMLGGFFPWSVFLPLGFWGLFKRASAKVENSQRDASIFTLSWFFVIFIFFSISSTKLPTYIFPSFISLALIAAVVWDDFLTARHPAYIKKWMPFSYYALPVIIVPGAVAASLYVKSHYPVILNGVIMSAAFLSFGGALSLLAFIRKKFIAAFFFIIYLVVIFLYPMEKLIIPELEKYETSKEIAGKLNSFMKPQEPLGSESNYLAGLAFYTGKFPTDLDKHHAMVQFLSRPDRVWCVIKEKNHRQLYEVDTKPRYSKDSYMLYKIGKRAIVTNQMPDDGIYLLKRTGTR